MLAFNERAESGFDEYTGIFDNFIDSYRQNLEELQELSLQMIEILDSFQYMTSNDNFLSNLNGVLSGNLSGLGGSNSSSSGSIWYNPSENYLLQALNLAASGDLDGAMDALARRNQKVQDQGGNDRGTSANEAYNLVMQAYKTGKIPSRSTSSSSSSSSGSSNKVNSIYNSIQNAINSSSGGKVSIGNSGLYIDTSKLKGYAEGIENGPVTETGLAMLHGSESSPEYVLNSDQAYNLLREQALGESDSSRNNGILNTNNTGTAQSGKVDNSIDGLNKIISQISVLVNTGSLTNSQLIQSVVLQQKIIELITSLYDFQKEEKENKDERLSKIIEQFDLITATINSNFEGLISNLEKIQEQGDSILKNQEINIESISEVLKSVDVGVEYLGTLNELLGQGFGGSFYLTSEAGGKFNGGFGNNYGSAYNDNMEGGGGGGGSNEEERGYGVGWTEGIDYLVLAKQLASEGKTDEAYEALLKRNYKIIDTGNNNGTTQAEAVQIIKDILSEGGYSTVSSLGDSGIYDADYINDKKGSSSGGSSGSSSSSRPNYGGYDNRDDFNNAIKDAEKESNSTGGKVNIGNSGLYIDTSKLKSYSSGIENGPITYTGMAMLHGSPDMPEYVLNSDQAYNLLKNMSTLRMAEFESNNNSGEGVNYIVEGDIILQDVNNPAEFWKKVTNTMENRWNVTKNKKH